MQKGELPDLVKDEDTEDTIKFPCQGGWAKLFPRDLKMQGVVGDLDQKNTLGYQSLISPKNQSLLRGTQVKK